MDERIVKERVVMPPAVRHAPVVEVVVVFALRGLLRFMLAARLLAVFTPVFVRILLGLLGFGLPLRGARPTVRRVHSFQLRVTADETEGENAEKKEGARFTETA